MEARTILLNKMLDALDRLFDREASVMDIYRITSDTAQALRTDALFPLIEEAEAKLQSLMKTGLPATVARDQAQDATNALRIAIAESLPLSGDAAQ